MRKVVTLFTLLVLTLNLCACSKKVEEPTWQEQYNLGVRYLSEGNYEEAVLAFKAAIEIDPKRAEAYEKLADTYLALGDTDAALKTLQDSYDATRDARLRARIDELTAPELTPTPTPGPASEPTPTPTPEPASEPTPTPEPTPEPTPTLELSAEPTPTSEPTPTPELTPVPTPESMPEPTHAPVPTPTPVPTVDGTYQCDFTFVDLEGNKIPSKAVMEIGPDTVINVRFLYPSGTVLHNPYCKMFFTGNGWQFTIGGNNSKGALCNYTTGGQTIVVGNCRAFTIERNPHRPQWEFSIRFSVTNTAEFDFSMLKGTQIHAEGYDIDTPRTY